MTEQEQIELWAREVRAQEGMETSKDKLLCEMAHVGYIKNKFEVCVHSKEGPIPHFHVWDIPDGERFHACIRFDKPEYFDHQGKDDHLNSKDKKDLKEFLNSKPVKPKGPFKTYWEILVFMWSISNPDKDLGMDYPMPDYSKLPS